MRATVHYRVLTGVCRNILQSFFLRVLRAQKRSNAKASINLSLSLARPAFGGGRS